MANLSRIANEVRRHTAQHPSEELSTLLFLHHLGPYLTEDGADIHGVLEAATGFFRSIETRIDALEGTAADNQFSRARSNFLYGGDTLGVDAECAAVFGQSVAQHFPDEDFPTFDSSDEFFYRGMADMWRRNGAFLAGHLYTAAVEHRAEDGHCYPTDEVVVGALCEAFFHLESQAQALQHLITTGEDVRVAGDFESSANLNPAATYALPTEADASNTLRITANFMRALIPDPVGTWGPLCDAFIAFQEMQDDTDIAFLQGQASVGDVAAVLRLKTLERQPLPDVVATWMRQTANVLEKLDKEPGAEEVLFHAAQMLAVFEQAQRHLATRMGIKVPALPEDL